MSFTRRLVIAAVTAATLAVGGVAAVAAPAGTAVAKGDQWCC